MSASTPAGSAKRNMGRLDATWISDTVIGLASRPVISQPDAALYIQVPMFETTVAVHMIAKVRWRNADQKDWLADRSFGS